jgi:beta-xylosidase
VQSEVILDARSSIDMKKSFSFLYFLLIFPTVIFAQQSADIPGKNIPLDSIRLSDPCILADVRTAMYYMTGTGGLLWKSKDLKLWDGPFRVTKTDPRSWMGPRPMIWAAELHAYKGKYYYFATFTNRDVKIDTVKGNVIERRASHVLW